ncbi:MAG: phosphatidylserine/phosphatidylglycerophosphate/cardiolipin synthase family protein [Proteobacteria bacterium]|nr:MAG: phosphatidylserine/phosphatidylglycerophosphate/cardiolipin synthase family protein [Pseudomonadota bacterium]
MVSPSLQRGFPWRDGNHFELYTASEDFLAAMLEAIAAARDEVLLEMYLFETGAVADHFIEQLCAAAQRGVTVRVLLDAFGARNLSAHDRYRLRAGNVALTLYNPLAYHKWRHNLRRDHRKLLLVDRRIGFTGGTAISDTVLPQKSRHSGWRETMVAMHGPVLDDWAHLFASTWQRCCALPPSLPQRIAAVDGNMAGRLVTASGAHKPEILRSFVGRIKSAKHRVWMSTAYFIPTNRLRRSLCSAARRGIEVRLLLPGRLIDHPGVRYAGRRYFGRLLRAGVRIFEYRPQFLHSKVLLCDEWVSIGSSNLDRWNQLWNLDANQEIDDVRFAAVVERMFRDDFEHAREISAARWRQRPWWKRLQERIWGTVDSWLFRITGQGLAKRKKSGRQRRPP